MSSSGPAAASQRALLLGCAGGPVLAAIFLGISGGVYLALTAAHLPERITILLAVLSGPLIGTVGTLLIMFSLRARKTRRGDDRSP